MERSQVPGPAEALRHENGLRRDHRRCANRARLHQEQRTGTALQRCRSRQQDRRGSPFRRPGMQRRPDLPPRRPDLGRTWLSPVRPDRRTALVPPVLQALRADLNHHDNKPRVRRMARPLRRCEDDNGTPRPPDASPRDRPDRQRKLALQEPGMAETDPTA
jgi:hypothetical protein